MNGPPAAAPLSPAEARRLAAERQWPRLAAYAPGLPPEQLAAEPEVAFHVADALWRVGGTEDALRLCTAIEDTVCRDGNRRLRLNVVNVLGIALFQSGRNDEAEQRFGELLLLATEWGDDEFAARAANNLGVVANVRGRRELALTYYERALAAYQRLGHLRGLAQTHHNLGISYRDLGFPRESDAHFLRAIDFATRAGSEDVLAFAETERAMLHAQTGDGTLADSLAQRAMSRFETIGDLSKRGEVLRVRATAARARGELTVAVDLLREALELARSYSVPLLEAESRRDLGLALRDLGRAEEARAALEEAAAGFARLGAEAEAAAARNLAGTL